jgi:hypothetical protein
MPLNDRAYSGYGGFTRRPNILRRSWVPALALLCFSAAAARALTLTITDPPNGSTVDNTVTLRTTASGGSPPWVKYYRNGSCSLSGATQLPGFSQVPAPYNYSWNTVPFSNGTYTIIVQASSGETACTVLYVAHAPPAITVQPKTQNVSSGQTATFSVSATGTLPLSYQWKKNNANISGATGASYTTPAVTPANSGEFYSVVVSNSLGSATSASAELRVWAWPPVTWSQAISGGATPIRAVHINELRTAIDERRINFGLGAYPWTDAVSAGSTRIRKVHMDELRSAINQVRSNYNDNCGGMPPSFSFTDPTLTAGATLVRGLHITELRQAVDQITAMCQGCCGTCRKCDGAGCVNQTSAEDVWNDCAPSGPPSCRTGDCDGAGGCETIPAVTCYKDEDGDGYGSATASLQFCGSCGTDPDTGIPYIADNTDCYDADPDAFPRSADAKPGQTGYFWTHRGDGSFDYNCADDDGNGDGSDKEPGTNCVTLWDGGCDSGDPGCITGRAGYVGAVPACGASADFVTIPFGCGFASPGSNSCTDNGGNPVNFQGCPNVFSRQMLCR